MENPESLLLELEEFNRGSGNDKEIPQNLENFIEFISKSGTYIYPWSSIRKLFIQKTSNVINNLAQIFSSSSCGENLNSSTISQSHNPNDASNTDMIKERITERMKSFNSAPFTIQRISELLLKPNSHYNRMDKFLRGLEKCVMVVTTIDPNGNKIFIENLLTNGISQPTTNQNPPNSTPPIQIDTTAIIAQSTESIEEADKKIEIKTLITEQIASIETSSESDTIIASNTEKIQQIEETNQTIEEKDHDNKSENIEDITDSKPETE